jgi:NAD-dependent dihydropyrimidine dehydrogenase PreA subunit
MGIKNIDKELCDGCKVCVESCPMDVIRFNEDEQKAYPAYPSDCTVCYLCETDCPTGAITVTPDTVRKVILPY